MTEEGTKAAEDILKAGDVSSEKVILVRLACRSHVTR